MRGSSVRHSLGEIVSRLRICNATYLWLHWVLLRSSVKDKLQVLLIWDNELRKAKLEVYCRTRRHQAQLVKDVISLLVRLVEPVTNSRLMLRLVYVENPWLEEKIDKDRWDHSLKQRVSSIWELASVVNIKKRCCNVILRIREQSWNLNLVAWETNERSHQVWMIHLIYRARLLRLIMLWADNESIYVIRRTWVRFLTWALLMKGTRQIIR